MCFQICSDKSTRIVAIEKLGRRPVGVTVATCAWALAMPTVVLVEDDEEARLIQR